MVQRDFARGDVSAVIGGREDDAVITIERCEGFNLELRNLAAFFGAIRVEPLARHIPVAYDSRPLGKFQRLEGSHRQECARGEVQMRYDAGEHREPIEGGDRWHGD